MNSDIYRLMSPTRLFFRCAIPAIVTSIFGALYSVVDGMFVGRYLGEDALAAINLIMPVIMIIEAVSNMIATGASVNMSMLLGEEKKEDASRVFSFSVKFIFLFSCIISVLGYFFARPFIMFISHGASENAVRLSTVYLRIYAIFGPLIPIYFALDNYLRVCGKQRMSMIINIISQLINVVLDFVLIALLHKGVEAAAIASCIAIVLGSIAMLAAFTNRRLDVYYTNKNIPLTQFLHIVVNGSSEFFSSIAASVMSIVMNLFLLKYGGTTAVAAFSIVMYVDSIIGMLNFGMCDALQPAISYCYGGGYIERMRAIFRTVIIASVVVSVTAFLFMLMAGPYVARVFIKPGDDQLLQVSTNAIRIFAFSYLTGWVDMCISSYFTAMDKPGRSLTLSFFGTIVFPIGFLVALTSIWKLNGVWLMSSAAAFASSVLALLLVKTLKIENVNN